LFFHHSQRKLDDMQDQSLILDAEARRQSALIKVDLIELDKLFADDLVHIHSNGMTHNKTALLKYIEDRRAFISIQRGPLDIRIYGDSAVMIGKMKSQMRAPDGSPVNLEGMVTQILHRVNDVWRFTLFQFTRNHQ
jgi:ketosteroid isomerase-like protein